VAEKKPRYIVGIDLGTTNCVVAYSEVTDQEGAGSSVAIFEISQLVQAGLTAERSLLPSFIFLPGPHDVPEGSLELPWDSNNDSAVGEFARARGSEIPSRMIASAKSWLCNTAVDRNEKILPWEGSPESKKLSPVEAQAYFLQHIRNAWNFTMASDDKGDRLEDQEILLTVPASFDAVARELTVRAADQAGLPRVTLLEEPQAAFYAWLDKVGDDWRNLVTVGDMILVCDIGGGTTDLSLIEVAEQDGELVLNRIAVGNHILLGGDNMDLALAHTVRQKLLRQGSKIDSWQMRALWYACRTAKEALFQEPERHSYPLVILGQSSKLIAGSLRTELRREEMDGVLQDGFFPMCQVTDKPEERRSVGIKELGLAYAEDARISRHVAAFVHQQCAKGSDRLFPTAVLFNGGVMKAEVLRQRLLEMVRVWRSDDDRDRSLRELDAADADRAVALGAVYYGLAARGRGIRIHGGTPRPRAASPESALPAVPGMPAPLKALCVVPFGMEEGTEADIPGQEFGLVVGETARFFFLGSTVRHEDKVGDVIEDWNEEIDEITTMEAHLEHEQGEGVVIPVRLHSRVTEVGTLELWCVARDGRQRWKLEFNVREQK